MAPPRVRAVTLRHVLGFRCSGGECPESCCEVGWRIAVDEGHYRRLKRALGDAQFAKLVEPTAPAKRSRAQFGLLVLDERGACRQLDERKLCSIHARFGADLLGDVCALYPRVPSVVGDRRELQLVPSCPEAARGLLLGDGAADLVELPPAHFPADRKDSLRILDTRAAVPVVARFDDVRGTAYELLGDRTYPIGSRLAFTLGLASRLGELLSRSPELFDGQQFEDVIEQVQAEATRESLHRQLVGGGRAEDAAMAPHFVLEMLAARLAVPAQESFLRVALAALAGCESVGGRRLVTVAGSRVRAPSELRVSVEDLAAAHARRRGELSQTQAERLELALENYAKAHWMRDFYLDAPHLAAYAQALALRVAVIRFLVLGHPGTLRAREESDAGRAAALFDDALVECVYGFSRAMEHQTALFDNVMGTFEGAGMNTLRHGLALLRF